MRVVEIRGGFGVENLIVAERDEPAPGPGQVTVAVRAVSLNYRDLRTVRGLYNPKQRLPLIPCSDGAGEVVAVGPGVTRWKLGDRVMAAFAQGWIAGEPTREKLGTTPGGPPDGMPVVRRALNAEGPAYKPAPLWGE